MASRPTVHDVAREAGVSLATVDRVLNARSGVRPATARKVEEAMAKLRYERDIAAANLSKNAFTGSALSCPKAPIPSCVAWSRKLAKLPNTDLLIA